MALNAEGYFNGLRAYLNKRVYEIKPEANNKLVLEETMFNASGKTKQKVSLLFDGQIIAIKFDVKNKRGNQDPLFHFLDDEAKPWSKRCDFVIFQLLKNKINVYCVEFKSETIPGEASEQLKSSANWVKSLHSIIQSYTHESRQVNLKKFLFSNCVNSAAYLDPTSKYLIRDNAVRHYLYSDVDGLNLSDLENTNIEIIK